MADLKERNIALVSKDSDGVTTIDYPLTSTEMVEGLEDYVKEHGGTVKTVNGQAPDSGGNITLKIDAGGLPVGHEFFTTNPNLPAGCIPLLGGEYSRTTYADLWAWVQTQAGYLLDESAWQAKATANGGNVPYYSKGNGSTTFRVPALKCWMRGANSISEVGGYLTAGLPRPNVDITYPLNRYKGGISSNYGITGTDVVTSSNNTTNITNETNFLIKASVAASGVYGVSSTVQPPSIIGLWCVKAYGTVTNVGSTDVTNISTGLTEAETRISALENHGAGATVVETYRNGTEWYRVWSDGWLEQGGYGVTSGSGKKKDIVLLKPYIDADYTITYANLGGTHNYEYNDAWVSDKTSTSFSFNRWGAYAFSWYACGQGA